MDTTFHAGRYAGWRITDLPARFVRKFLSENPCCDGDLRQALEERLQRERRPRQRRTASAGSHDTPPVRVGDFDPALATQIVAIGKRNLARKHHPDRGGDVATMQRVLATAEALETMIGGRVR